MRALVWVIASAVWLTGCAVMTSIVREEAAGDLDCPAENLSVHYENDVFHVSGCDLRAKYVCSRDGLTPSLCTRRSLHGVRKNEQESRVRAKAAELLHCDPASLIVASAPGPGRYEAEGCGRRIGYECVTRRDCCAFTTPGVQPIDAAPPASAPSPIPERAEQPAQPARSRGSLTKAHIRQVIDGQIAGVRACYEAALGSGPSSAGVVAIQFIIAPDGHVQVAALDSSSLGLPKVEQCVVEHMRGLHFAKPEGGGIVVVTYPFTLETSGPYAECR